MIENWPSRAILLFAFSYEEANDGSWNETWFFICNISVMCGCVLFKSDSNSVIILILIAVSWF